MVKIYYSHYTSLYDNCESKRFIIQDIDYIVFFCPILSSRNIYLLIQQQPQNT